MNRNHSTLPQPTKEDGYRFLKKGEIIRDSDEVWDSFERRWCQVNATAGLDVDEMSVGCFRREVHK